MSCDSQAQSIKKASKNMNTTNGLSVATFAAGCYWCVEAQFQQLKGVEKIESGFMGGDVPNPTYEQVCTGTTNHAEVCNIYYDTNVISYDELVEAFFWAHDPTQLNRQGNDIGTQYRSAIFYRTAEEQEKAHYYIQQLMQQEVFGAPIVTEVSPASEFYIAPDYHENYYNLNPNQGYCQFVIKPKLEKFKKAFANKLK